MKQLKLLFVYCLLGTFLFSSHTSYATFSIAACDENTGRCGVAVATHNLAVGDGVPFAEAMLGAGVSQFETNPQHAAIILDTLRTGSNANTALKKALKHDAKFTDGNDTTFRQIGVVSFKGDAAAFTGKEASAYAGHRAEGLVSVQGNGLTSDAVLAAMWDCFHKTKDPLAERLLKALESGYEAGGQTIGLTSAALLVATPDGWPVDTNLRADFSNTAIADLRKSYNANIARQYLFRARNFIKSGDKDKAKKLIEKALELAPEWDRIWLNSGWLAESMNDGLLAQKSFCKFQKINPVWAKMLSDEIDFSECQ